MNVNVCRNPGFEDDKKQSVKGSINDEKLLDNIMRAKSKVLEYAFCNPWDYFATFTIDGKKWDRYNLENYHKALGQFIRNYNRKYGLHIKYLTIPEQHQDGAWHEHGFIMGLPAEHLRLFKQSDNIPQKLKNSLKKGVKVYEWVAYRDNFGWCDFEPINSQEACGRYVTKYISKDLARSITELNAHLYYCSKGLAKATEIKRGHLCASSPLATSDDLFTWESDFCRVGWFDYSDELLKNLSDCII